MNSLNCNVFLLERGKIRSVPATIKNLKNIFHVMISVRMFKVRFSFYVSCCLSRLRDDFLAND